MNIEQNTLRKTSLFCAASLLAMSVASPSLAKAPYYFVDNNSNIQSLYDRPNCNGEQKSCVGFGDYCGIKFYSSRNALDKGKVSWKFNGRIDIRRYSGNVPIICKLRKK